MPDHSIPQSSDSVFVIGCPRSATSALSWALAQHPDFWTSAESNFISRFFNHEWLQNQYASGITRQDKHWLSLNKVSYEEYSSYIGLGVDLLYQSRSNGKRWIEQTPEYTLYVTHFATMFPNAKFVHSIRDGRLVVQSMIHSGFPVAWATDFKLACQTWVKFVTEGLELKKTHPNRILEVRHENLTADPETQCGLIFQFLKAEPHDGAANFLKSSKINSSFKGGDKPKAEKWHDWSKGQIKTFISTAGPTMQMLGYDLD
jgi:hypothetical protein